MPSFRSFARWFMSRQDKEDIEKILDALSGQPKCCICGKPEHKCVRVDDGLKPLCQSCFIDMVCP